MCGSYATGNQNEFSDIDVCILLSDSQDWRERGCVIKDGFLIEYFINPIKQMQREFREDYSNGGNCSANMYEMDITKIQKLYDFVIKCAGGFDIKTFKTRAKLPQ